MRKRRALKNHINFLIVIDLLKINKDIDFVKIEKTLFVDDKNINKRKIFVKMLTTNIGQYDRIKYAKRIGLSQERVRQIEAGILSIVESKL